MNDQPDLQPDTALSQARPYTTTRTVTWGDCDPAGIIYTPRVLDIAMETVEAWYRDVLDMPWVKLNRELHMGAPTVRAEIDFVAAPAPDDDVVTALRIKKLGRSSVTFHLTGGDGHGKVYYRATIVGCFVTKPAFKPTAIPDPYRTRILEYQATCGDV